MEAGIGRDRLKRLARLREAKVREAEGLQLIEGPRLVEEALRAGAVSELFVRDDAARDLWTQRAGAIPVHVIGAPGLDRLCDVRTPQEVAAIGPLPDEVRLGELLGRSTRVLFLDGVQDPGNVGTLARTARALGVSALAVGPGTADPAAPKVLRASAGALFHLPRARATCGEVVAEARRSGHRLVVPVVRGGEDVREVSAPECYVLVAGSEGSGSALGDPSALRVTVPMSGGSESLNVAAAVAAILARWL
jgi:TrmH family RNA methyltransferase